MSVSLKPKVQSLKSGAAWTAPAKRCGDGAFARTTVIPAIQASRALEKRRRSRYRGIATTVQIIRIVLRKN